MDARYRRHTQLSGWDQGRLKAATLAIAGVGALGNAAAQALGLAGVGRLILCDMDRIERSNLSRAGHWSGEVRPYLDPDGPCYGCGAADRPPEEVPNGRRTSCRVPAEPTGVGTTAPLSALIGDLLALLAVRRLMGLPVPADILELDGTTGAVARVRQRRDPNTRNAKPPAERTMASSLSGFPAAARPLPR